MPAASDTYRESPCGRFVCLRGGLALPVEPLLLALDLEARGVQLARDGDDIIARPASRLTDADVAGLRRWKPHVLALLSYEAPETVA